MLLGTLAGAEAALALSARMWWPTSILAIATALILAALTGYRLALERVTTQIKRTVAPLPAKVTLTFADNGSLSALVQRMDGDLATILVPDEVAEAGPEAAFRWVFEHSADE